MMVLSKKWFCHPLRILQDQFPQPQSHLLSSSAQKTILTQMIRSRTILIAACAISLAAAPLRAEDIAVAKDAVTSAKLIQASRKPETVLVADLARADKGVLFEGETAEAVRPGRYRLHAVMGFAPLGNIVNSTIDISVTAGDATRSVMSVHFPVADEFIDCGLDIGHFSGGTMPVAITWGFESEEAKDARTKAAARDAPKVGAAVPGAGLGDEAEDDEGEDDLLQLEIKGGRVPLADGQKIRYRLMLSGVHLEPLSPVAVTRVRADKVFYKPGESAVATATIRNLDKSAESVTLKAELLSGLTARREIASEALKLAPGESREWQGQFETGELRWGCELKVTATTSAGMETSKGEYFSVADDPWDVALIAAHPGHLAHFDKKERATEAAEELRSQGFTGFEAFFWAPCDFMEFTPDTEKFFSGQTAYPGSITGTKNMIDAAHQHGMVATVYSNLWGGSGPPVYEVMRQHPDWFGPTSFNAYVLDDWDLMRAGRIRAPGIAHWCSASLRLNPSDDTFRRHAQELIDSHHQFGWDGVRYDSYYSRYWNLRAMSVARPMIRKVVPGFLFGYNSFAVNDHRAGALELMVEGGGMIMAEGIRIERTDYRGYASELLKWRDIVWPYGGHVGPIYQGKGQENVLTPLDQMHYSSVILASGAHPYYHPLESAFSEHQLFAKRYSEFVYDNRMRPLKAPEQVIAFGKGADFFFWKQMARTVTLSGQKRRLVVHLINSPENGKPFVNWAMKRPTVHRNLPVTLTLPAGAKVTGAWALKAFPTAQHTTIPIRKAGDAWTGTINEVLYWTVLVVDYESDEPLAEPLTPKDLTDTYIQHWKVIGPFPNPTDEQKGFEAVYPPEEKLDLDAACEGSDGKEVRWGLIHAKGAPELAGSLIDLRRHFSKKDYVCAYAFTKVTSDRDREAVMVASASDCLTVWFNGKQTFAKKGTVRDITLDMYQIPVQLRKGGNTILLKVCNRWLSWGFYVRLADKEGVPLLDGMSYGLE